MQALATLSNSSSESSGRRWFPALAFLLLGLASPASAADDIDLLKYELRDLQSEQLQRLDQFRGKTTLVMFFEPECPFCFKQTKILNGIQRECADFQAIGVGVNGSRRDLQEEIRHLDPSFPAYQVNAELQKEVGKVEGTPMMLVADKNGLYSSHLRGYQQLDTLLPVLAKAGLECS